MQPMFALVQNVIELSRTFREMKTPVLQLSQGLVDFCLILELFQCQIIDKYSLKAGK